MPVFVSEDELRQMVNAALFDREHKPSSTYAAKVWREIRAEVIELRKLPGYVDMSAGLP